MILIQKDLQKNNYNDLLVEMNFFNNVYFKLESFSKVYNAGIICDSISRSFYIYVDLYTNFSKIKHIKDICFIFSHYSINILPCAIQCLKDELGYYKICLLNHNDFDEIDLNLEFTVILDALNIIENLISPKIKIDEEDIDICSFEKDLSILEIPYKRQLEFDFSPLSSMMDYFNDIDNLESENSSSDLGEMENDK